MTESRRKGRNYQEKQPNVRNATQAQEWRAIGFNVVFDLFVYQAALSQAVNELRRLL